MRGTSLYLPRLKCQPCTAHFLSCSIRLARSHFNILLMLHTSHIKHFYTILIDDTTNNFIL